jgi:UDP-N-acetylglucosamine 1-carboxyvinyltransferase
MTQQTVEHVGALLRDARGQKGWTQGQLAAELGTSQSAIARMEQGKQNLSLKMIQRLESIFGQTIVKVGRPQMTHLRVEGGRTLSGAVDVNSSKNAGVALLCAGWRGLRKSTGSLRC